jgi:hypothetical protein
VRIFETGQGDDALVSASGLKATPPCVKKTARQCTFFWGKGIYNRFDIIKSLFNISNCASFWLVFRCRARVSLHNGKTRKKTYRKRDIKQALTGIAHDAKQTFLVVGVCIPIA